MKITELIRELDDMSSNKERTDYLNSIRTDRLLERHDLKRIAANILIEESFVEKYYTTEFTNLIKISVSKFCGYFKNYIK